MTDFKLSAATVDLDPAKGRLLLTYRLSGQEPTNGHWLVSTTLVGGPDGPIQQFGFKLVDGDVVSVFLFDHVNAGQKNYTQNPQRVGDKWTVSFPAEDVAVAPGAQWRADLDVDGTERGHIEGHLN
ncbi:hypothetical protein [Nocardioides pocheonensis]|jgi:hypothetical protein|uniref:Uncharacterized protein n=1 Tax=Nocardioides pocheonensis TaxID=661485 RepID=A0A3N0GH24_9ACTN|nr:hypothetical protein [Nocardioides pocheonensis]RNM11729.1 hypothetical protein EFL26_21470 [Nocardioides pocheonensis]